jgi:hypothetical protein
MFLFCLSDKIKLYIVSRSKIMASKKNAQQSVHPTLGILARFQAVFYASAFSQSDGVPPPAPARVTQTVGQLKSNTINILAVTGKVFL